MLRSVEGSAFDEEALFGALARSGVRVLLIGRRALVALGLPVLTADYDVWVDIEQCAALNAAVEPFDLHPNRSPEEARQVGRYILHGDERIDVLVARQVSTREGVPLRFEDAWARHVEIPYSKSISLRLPCLDDLILTKRWSMRPKDMHDIELLEKLQKGQAGS